MAYQPEIQVARLIADGALSSTPNMLRQAAYEPFAADAIRSLRTMLLLPDESASDSLIDAAAWRRATYAQRLEMVASWFRAECFAETERMNTLVESTLPMQSVCTND
jgi:hypothetical protein